MGRVLIVGGYGAFGARAAERLAREPGLAIIIAGRSADKARIHADALKANAQARIGHAVLDAASATAEALRSLAPNVVINASGPFQQQDYALARACIAAGCHYVDLADARAFVTGIGALDGAAKAAGVSVIAAPARCLGSRPLPCDAWPRACTVSTRCTSASRQATALIPASLPRRRSSARPASLWAYGGAAAK